MLQKLSIKNFILISDLDIDFHKGLTVLSGETGAGKSMILQAIRFLFSKKNSQNFKKNQEKPLIIELIFNNQGKMIDSISDVLEEQGINLDDEILILRKIITKDDRVNCKINDANVTSKFMSLILAHLLEIHGQFDNNDLFDNNNHVKYIDFKLRKENEQILDQLSDSYQQYSRNLREYEELKARKESYENRLDDLAVLITDLEKFNPAICEYDELLLKRDKLKNHVRLTALYNTYNNKFFANEALQDILLDIQKDISRNISYDAENFNKILEEIEKMLQSCDQIANIFNESDNISADDLDEIEARISDYKTLSRKYNCDVTELESLLSNALQEREQLTEKLTKFADYSAILAELEEKYIALSDIVNVMRQKIANKLEGEIHKILQDLYMVKTKFKVVFNEISKKSWSGLGNKQIIFTVATNLGSPYGELTKIASGGELSRFMLALKLALICDKKTLIFDEIDTGISGKVSEAVGNKLSGLSKNNQVIIITHQAQVAAQSDNHYRIIKSYEKDTTNITIKSLSNQEKIEEIAAMISGKNITDHARETAKAIINSRPA